MNKEKLFHRWRDQYRRLLERQELLLREARAEGLPEHVHELRVTLRRLRLMVRVSGPLVDHDAAVDYRRWSRKITNATSHLRDCDVTIEWLADQPGSDGLIEALQARRLRLWKMGRRHLIPLPVSVLKAVKRLDAGKRDQQRLARRYPRRFARLHARVVSQIPSFFELDTLQRHAFRRTTRLLRYLRELALPKSLRASDRMLKALTRPQAAMGQYQNLLLVEPMIASLKRRLPPAVQRALNRQKNRGQAEIRAALRELARTYRSNVRAGRIQGF